MNFLWLSIICVICVSACALVGGLALLLVAALEFEQLLEKLLLLFKVTVIIREYIWHRKAFKVWLEQNCEKRHPR